MKRRTTLAGINLSYSLSWVLVVLTATICFLSCACRNKVSAPAPESKVQSTAPAQKSANTFVPQSELESVYQQIIATVKAKDGYSLYGEFLDNGKYLNSFMRMDILKFLVIIPSDAAIRSLGEAEMSKLIYPELVTQDHLNFFHKHTAFGAVAEGPNPSFRTYHNRVINLDIDKKELTSGNFKTRVVHVEKPNPAIQLLFVENLIN